MLAGTTSDLVMNALNLSFSIVKMKKKCDVVNNFEQRFDQRGEEGQPAANEGQPTHDAGQHAVDEGQSALD